MFSIVFSDLRRWTGLKKLPRQLETLDSKASRPWSLAQSEMVISGFSTPRRSPTSSESFQGSASTRLRRISNLLLSPLNTTYISLYTSYSRLHRCLDLNALGVEASSRKWSSCSSRPGA